MSASLFLQHFPSSLHCSFSVSLPELGGDFAEVAPVLGGQAEELAVYLLGEVRTNRHDTETDLITYTKRLTVFDTKIALLTQKNSLKKSSSHLMDIHPAIDNVTRVLASKLVIFPCKRSSRSRPCAWRMGGGARGRLARGNEGKPS